MQPLILASVALLSKKLLPFCHNTSRRPKAHNGSANDNNSKLFLDTVRRFQPLGHITIGAFTRVCLVILAMASVVGGLSVVDYKNEQFKKTVKSSRFIKGQAKSSVFLGDARRDMETSAAYVVRQRDTYKPISSSHLAWHQNKIGEYNYFDKDNAPSSYNRIDYKDDERSKINSTPTLILSDLAVARLIVAASLTEHTGSCACPYQRGRNGISCAGRSAYSRGSSQLCYVADVTPRMIKDYRDTH